MISKVICIHSDIHSGIHGSAAEGVHGSGTEGAHEGEAEEVHGSGNILVVDIITPG